MNPFYLSQVFDLVGVTVKANWKPLLMGLAALSIAGASFAAGWSAKGSTQHQEAAAIAQERVRTITKEVKVRDEVIRTVYVADLAKVRALEADKQRLSALVASLTAQVNSYVPEIPTTPYLSVGAVGLLDAAATGVAPDPASTAGVLAGQDSPASNVSWRDFVAAELAIRQRYNDVRSQCNALIDWTETNIVNNNN